MDSVSARPGAVHLNRWMPLLSVPNPKAGPIKLWLPKVGYERIQEISGPEPNFSSALLEHLVATACEPSRVGGFSEGQPIARSDVLRRRLKEPWLQRHE